MLNVDIYGVAVIAFFTIFSSYTVTMSLKKILDL